MNILTFQTFSYLCYFLFTSFSFCLWYHVLRHWSAKFQKLVTIEHGSSFSWPDVSYSICGNRLVSEKTQPENDLCAAFFLYQGHGQSQRNRECSTLHSSLLLWCCDAHRSGKVGSYWSDLLTFTWGYLLLIWIFSPMMTCGCFRYFQAFYSKFYIPEKDIYPAEVENTDKLARALVVSCGEWNVKLQILWHSVDREAGNTCLRFSLVCIWQGFCEAVIPLVTHPVHLKSIISCISAIIPSSTVPNSVSRMCLHYGYKICHEHGVVTYTSSKMIEQSESYTM